jgi:transposase
MKEVQDLAAQLEAIKQLRKLRRKRRYARPSKLDPHRLKMIAMFRKGSSFKDINIWLEKQGVSVSVSTVSRYINSYVKVKS